MGLEGRSLEFVGEEQAEMKPGDLLLISPGTPHYAMRLSYPGRNVVVYFLPGLLLQLGPNGDGARILSRFTACQSLRDRRVRLSPSLRKALQPRFEEMIRESNQPKSGSELRLRAVLMEMLVELIRWEERKGRPIPAAQRTTDWKPIEKALHFLQEHYAEPVYADQLAVEAGVSVSRLRITFREVMGMPWVHFLQAYRVHQACVLLNETDRRVTEVAFKVGFDSLSHFNTAFHHFAGMSPSDYVDGISQKRRRTRRDP